LLVSGVAAVPICALPIGIQVRATGVEAGRWWSKRIKMMAGQH